MPVRRVGYVLAEYPEDAPVLGAAVAEVELLRALSASTSAAITVFGGAAQLRALRALGSRVDLRDRRDIIDVVQTKRIDVLHSSFVQAWQLLQVRELVGWQGTVTAVLHSAGYLDGRIPALKALLLTRRPPDAVICPSRHAGEALRRIARDVTRAVAVRVPASGRLRTVTIPHGVREQFLEPVSARARAAARRQLRLPPDGVLLLYAGRLSPWSKMELFPLLVAVHRLVAVGHRAVRLLLAGEEQVPGYRMRLLRIAQALGIRRFVHAPAGPADVRRCLAAADVFVSPADNVQETFGLTLLEAMAAGLPVVGSAWSGYKEIVKDGVTGYLVPVCAPVPDGAVTAQELFRGSEAALYHVAQTTAVDVDALVDRLERLVSSPERRARMGRRGRELVRARFTWGHVVASYEALWDRLCRRRPVPARRPAFYDVDYAGCFGHFASRSFPDAVELTPLGSAVLGGVSPVAPWLFEMAAWAQLERPRLLAVLRAVGRKQRSTPSPELAFALKHWLVRGRAAHNGRAAARGG